MSNGSRPAYTAAKRMIDLVGAALGMLILAPLLLAVSIAVRVALGAPVLFRQLRAGRGGLGFHIYKFRTMGDAYGPDGSPLPDEQRLGAFGRFLRSTSLDELPSLWNVLRGDMSLVGPRPLPVEYLPRYSEEQGRRHDVLPGLTGWAQIHGRNEVEWERRFELDTWYVRHATLWLDLAILVRTAVIVLSRKGVSAPGHATMTKFEPPQR